jgi:hypothetical protein
MRLSQRCSLRGAELCLPSTSSRIAVSVRPIRVREIVRNEGEHVPFSGLGLQSQILQRRNLIANAIVEPPGLRGLEFSLEKGGPGATYGGNVVEKVTFEAWIYKLWTRRATWELY